MRTIVLTGGGTAGHCTPNVALLPYLQEHFDKIYYIGSEKGIEKDIIKKTSIPYYSTNCVKLERNKLISNLKIPFVLLKGIKSSTDILKKIKPNVIFSKGGYVAVPTIIAGKKLNIPVISHESDYTIGLANKLTSRYCKKVLTSFEDTSKELKNGLHVGPPLRNELFNVDKSTALKFFNLSGFKPILLITGGSQGAKAINDAIRIILQDLLKTFDIIHICGKNNRDESLTQKGYIQLEYLDKIEYAFNVCDVCVTRAGSNTLFELLSLKKPCLVIPLPKGASRGDQILNANYFHKKNMINLLFQENVNPNIFLKEIINTYNNKSSLILNLSKNPIENSCKKICEIILNNC